MGTRTIIVAGHTDCGLLNHDEEAACRLIEQGAGTPAHLPAGVDPVARGKVRRSVRRLRQSPYLHHTDDVHGYVYDVHSGLLTSVQVDDD